MPHLTLLDSGPFSHIVQYAGKEMHHLQLTCKSINETINSIPLRQRYPSLEDRKIRKIWLELYPLEAIAQSISTIIFNLTSKRQLIEREIKQLNKNIKKIKSQVTLTFDLNILYKIFLILQNTESKNIRAIKKQIEAKINVKQRLNRDINQKNSEEKDILLKIYTLYNRWSRVKKNSEPLRKIIYHMFGNKHTFSETTYNAAAALKPTMQINRDENGYLSLFIVHPKHKNRFSYAFYEQPCEPAILRACDPLVDGLPTLPPKFYNRAHIEDKIPQINWRVIQPNSYECSDLIITDRTLNEYCVKNLIKLHRLVREKLVEQHLDETVEALSSSAS